MDQLHYLYLDGTRLLNTHPSSNFQAISVLDSTIEIGMSTTTDYRGEKSQH